MNRRAFRGAARLLRRSAALAMALVAVWAAAQTVPPPDLPEAALGLGEDAGFVVGLLSAQLGYRVPGEGRTALDGWGRLLVDQSALLSSAAPQVERLRRQSPPPAGEPAPAEEGEEGSQPQLDPIPEGEVVEHTALGADDGSYLSADRVYIKNVTGQAVDAAALAAQPVELDLGEGPQILIYHTHGSESYTQTQQERYVESDPYRTTDCTHNVVRVGEEMAEVFRSLGFEVVHDTTLYDYPVYTGAYERSGAAVSAWLEQYPTIRFVLDVHRDALVSADGAAYKLIAQEGEERIAQVMLVAGSDDSGAEHPNWRQNLALAVKLQAALTWDYEQLARPITLRSTRFNQHLSPGALLVEVGGHGNTLEEAIPAARLFARTAGETLKNF